MYGITGIQMKVIDVHGTDAMDVNLFLEEYDGNIIDIRTEQMLYGVTRYVIIYKAKE
jgi:hypothetical protein